MVNDELFYVMSFRNMLQEFRTVSLMVDKFSGSERKTEFESYLKSLREFESEIFQDIKPRVFHINKRLLEMHDLLNERIN